MEFQMIVSDVQKTFIVCQKYQEHKFKNYMSAVKYTIKSGWK